MDDLTLRAFSDDDLPLFARWLQEPHVAKWYERPDAWLHEVAHRADEFPFIRHYIAELSGKPVGFCQYYRYCDGGEAWHGGINPAGAYSMDYLLGETNCLHRGYGKRMVAKLIARIWENADAKRIIVQPEKANVLSRKTLRACGFMHDAANDVFIMERYALSR